MSYKNMQFGFENILQKALQIIENNAVQPFLPLTIP